jgi:hypothetical protein
MGLRGPNVSEPEVAISEEPEHLWEPDQDISMYHMRSKLCTHSCDSVSGNLGGSFRVKRGQRS